MSGKKTEATAPAAATVSVEVLYSITHDGLVYGRGLHELKAELAELFLGLRAPAGIGQQQPVAQLPTARAARVLGTITRAPDNPPGGPLDQKAAAEAASVAHMQALAATVAKAVTDTQRTARRRRRAGPGKRQRGGTEPPAKFWHSTDYRLVRLRGQQLHLTSRQAQIIQILHEAYEKGEPQVSTHSLMEDVGAESSRLRDAFRSRPGALKALVSRPRRGYVQLNL